MCKVFLESNDTGVLLSALSDFDFSQTFSKNTLHRRTIHGKVVNALNSSDSLNPASFSLEVYLTGAAAEGVLFEIVGLNKVGESTYESPECVSREPNYFSLLFTDGSTCYRLNNAAIQNLDIPMSKGSVTTLSIGGTAALLEKIAPPAYTLDLEQGDILPLTFIDCKINGIQQNAVTTTSFSFINTVDWREYKTLHTVGIASPDKAKTGDIDCTMTLNFYCLNDIEISEPTILSEVTLEKDGIQIKLKDVLAIPRDNVEDVFTKSLDISTIEASKIFVEYI